MGHATRYAILYVTVGLLGLLAGCQAAPAPRVALTPFPTMTAGAVIVGDLSLEGGRVPDAIASGLSNPSTAVALMSQPTATPDYSSCPALDETVTLVEDAPDNVADTSQLIIEYLTLGGGVEALENHLRDAWAVVSDDAGYLRAEVDLTGNNLGEVVIGFRGLDGVGALLVAGCRDGRYELLTRITSDTDEVPTLIWLGDMNNALPSELVIARRACSAADACEYETLLLGWNRVQGRFANLLDEELLTLDMASVSDYDGDDVAELVVRLSNRGTSATGPLRTGINIYDWNGSVYTLSIIQLDAPRYRIQLIHEGDRLFAERAFEDAVRLYTVALSEGDLRYWFNDGPIAVDSYGLYRLVLAYAVLGDGERLSGVVATLNERFPTDEETPVESLPVYVHMAYVFLNTLLDTQDLHLGCVAALGVVDEREEALSLLNRYGSRSPTYRRLDLCPF